MCCEKVVVYRRWPYLVKDQLHIMARTAQISKEKRQSIITLTCHALIDLGATISLISQTLFDDLKRALKPTKRWLKVE